MLLRGLAGKGTTKVADTTPTPALTKVTPATRQTPDSDDEDDGSLPDASNTAAQMNLKDLGLDALVADRGDNNNDDDSSELTLDS